MRRFFSGLIIVFCAAVSMIDTATASKIIQPAVIHVQNVGAGDTNISVTFTKPDGSTFEPPVQNYGDQPLAATFDWTIPNALSWTATASTASSLVQTDPPGEFGGSVLLSSITSGPVVMNVPAGQTGTVYASSLYSGNATRSTAEIQLQGSIGIVSIEAVPLPGAVWSLSGALTVLSRYRRAA